MATKAKPKTDAEELYIKIDSWEKLFRLGHIMFIMDVEEAIKGARKAGLIGASLALECDRDRLYKMKSEDAFHMGRWWWWMMEGKDIDLTHFERVLALTPWYLSSWQWHRDDWIQGIRKNKNSLYQRFGTIWEATSTFPHAGLS